VIYFDTSFLVPLVLPEATSEQIAAVIRELPADQLAVSHWTRVEFSSAVAREVRMGGLDASAAARADARFEAMVRDSFAVLLPTAADFDLARRYLARFETGLRAGDALHLAIASNQSAETIYSLDQALVRAGAILSLPVSTGLAAPGP
jgi:predicted nucleic acid-binding protein